MSASLERWINGLVLETLGADALAGFLLHPWLYALLTLGVLVPLGVLSGWWVGSRLLDWNRSLFLSLRLVRSRLGRHCLGEARDIRRGADRIRRALRQEIEDKTERRALLRVLDGFSHKALAIVLEQALRLIQRGNDRREARLHDELERVTEAWSRMEDGDAREHLLRDIADLRHRAEQARQANTQRDQWIAGLEQASLAMGHLEGELAALRLARDRHLPVFRDRLTEAAEDLDHLKQAHLELNDL